MRNVERRELVEGFLDDLRSQREVDLRDAIEELIHLTVELADDLNALGGRVSALEDRGPRIG